MLGTSLQKYKFQSCCNFLRPNLILWCISGANSNRRLAEALLLAAEACKVEGNYYKTKLDHKITKIAAQITVLENKYQDYCKYTVSSMTQSCSKFRCPKLILLWIAGANINRRLAEALLLAAEARKAPSIKPQ